MADLREQIQSLRYQNLDSRYFIPAGALNRVLTREAVQAAIRRCGIPPYDQAEVVELIMLGGRRLFAILVTIYRQALIRVFVKNDQLQKTKLDSQLPLSISDLNSILSRTDADDFYEKQWQFTAPIFEKRRGHRVLHKDTIFPFIISRHIGEGGCGKVFEVEVHPNHGDFVGMPPGQTRIIRKELKESGSHGPRSLNQEIHVLSFLNCLNHPNIVELLGSYTCNGVHNLLFPLATGDLNQLLTGREPPQHFRCNADFILALCGLSAAVEKLHNYTSGEFNVELIGCHRDLKPKNVLVDKGRFLLADFGFSKLKRVSESSKSLFEVGPGWYSAPECEDADNNFEPHLVGRSQDVWSLGCIISEVITYMTHGAEGVREYGERRRVTFGGITTKTFHTGNKPNPGVESWLSDLEATATPISTKLIHLVRDILQLKPSNRPEVKQITLRLRLLAHMSVFQSVSSSYEELTDHTQNLQFIIEKERFKLWGWAAGLRDTDNNNYSDERQEPILFHTCSVFDQTTTKLEEIAAELAMLKQPQNHPHASFLKLRMLNDDLAGTLPASLVRSIETRLEHQMVNTEDLKLLQDIKQTFDSSSTYRSIGTLAAIRYMHALCMTAPAATGEELRLFDVVLEDRRIFNNYELAVLARCNKTEWPKQRVLVERIVYEEHWTDDVGRELFDRVGAIAEVLRSASRTTRFRVLSCIGYFHEARNHAFALLFDLPISSADANHSEVKPVSLRKVIEDTQTNISHRPSLEDRFKLAQSLATTVSEIHKVGWVHKNISAFNVLFLSSGNPYPPKLLASPHLVGFNHSRPDNPGVFTTRFDIDELPYRHPDYREGENRYRKEYDYFSLGMVLLEIGTWKTLKSMTSGKDNLPPPQLLRYIIREWLPILGFYMGTTYRDVVATCLESDFGPSTLAKSSDSHTSKNMTYESIVIERLRKCLP